MVDAANEYGLKNRFRETLVDFESRASASFTTPANVLQAKLSKLL